MQLLKNEPINSFLQIGFSKSHGSKVSTVNEKIIITTVNETCIANSDCDTIFCINKLSGLLN